MLDFDGVPGKAREQLLPRANSARWQLAVLICLQSLMYVRVSLSGGWS
jgi:hypothetical protein